LLRELIITIFVQYTSSTSLPFPTQLKEWDKRHQSCYAMRTLFMDWFPICWFYYCTYRASYDELFCRANFTCTI